MYIKMLKTTILILCICAVTVLAKPALDESAAKIFIEESSDKFLELYIDLVKTMSRFDDLVQEENNRNASSSDEVDSFVIFEKFEKIQEILQKLATLAEETYKFPVDQYTEEEIKIGILKLKVRSGLLALGDDYKRWSYNDLSYSLNHENICKFKNENTECELIYADIAKALKSTTNEDEVLYYWTEWRKKASPKAIMKMKIFIELNKQLGEKYGETAKFAWFRDFLDEYFGENMEKVMTELEPLYKEIHAYIRYVLHEQFGNKVPENGLIPHHLYELAKAQTMKSDSFIVRDFKDVKMPIKNDFKESAKEVMEIASNFFKSLGLSELPEDFWNKNIKERDIKGDDCTEQIFDSGNVTHFRYCNKVDVNRFLKIYENVAIIYYANERKNLPFAYTQPFYLQLATGEAVSLSIVTPKYLHKIGHKDAETVPEIEELNRLYRMGVHTLFGISERFVHVKVISDVLDGTVELENLNTHYWDLMKKYVGVGAPVVRDSADLDFPIQFYDLIENNKQCAEFFSKVTGYQIYKSLCKKSGNYTEGDKMHQLYNCDFSDSKEAGKLLKSMMQLGAKKTWKKVLGTVTGDETGMKADGLLEYYKSLQEWLHRKNTQNGVTIGW